VAEELVCQVTQSVPTRLKLAGGTRAARLLGGTTLIFGDDGREGRLRYAISKRIDGRRQKAQQAWLAESGL
jgi:hypothetical protein